MPFYRIGRSMAHIRMSRRDSAPAACPFFVMVNGERVRCMAMAPYLCDWLGCNAPICEDHRLSVGSDLDVCPSHNHQRGLFSRLLPPPPTEKSP